MKGYSPKICIFGAGRVGGTLYNCLLKDGIDVSVFSKREEWKKKYSFEKFIKSIGGFDIIILSIPDSEIENVTHRIYESIDNVKKRIILHTSGTISFKALKSLEEKGFIVGSLHPYFSFYKIRKDVKTSDIRFTLSCERKYFEHINKILRHAKINTIYIDDRYKIQYHISAVFVSNFTALFLRIASLILEDAGLKRVDIESLVFSLLDSTLYNLKRFGIEKTITGPAIRRDERILNIHKRFLRKYNRDFHRLYSVASSIIQKIY